jgi:hypothetical protein
VFALSLAEPPSSSVARSAASRTQPVQSPSGASEKIFAPQLRQILVTVFTAAVSLPSALAFPDQFVFVSIRG